MTLQEVVNRALLSAVQAGVVVCLFQRFIALGEVQTFGLGFGLAIVTLADSLKRG